MFQPPKPDQVQRRLKTEQRPHENINNNTEEDVKSVSEPFKPTIRWPDLTVQLFIHLGCLYGFYLAAFRARFYTTLFGKKAFSKNTKGPLEQINIRRCQTDS